MTVSTSTAKVVHSGNGAVGVPSNPWPFSFKVYDVSHLRLIYTDTGGAETVLTSGFSVALHSDQTATPGGIVVYPTVGSALPTGTKFTIMRVVPLVQLTDLQSQGGYYPEVIERQLDLLAMQIQQISDETRRSVRAPESDATVPAMPSATQRAIKVLGFDADGTPAALPYAAVGGVVPPESLTVTRPVTGARTRTLAQVAVERISATEFMVGDGATDNTANIVNMLTAIEGKELFIPPGEYRFDALQFNPLTDKRLRILGAGMDVVNLRPHTPNASSLLLLGAVPANGIKFYAHLEGFTLDGIDKSGFAGLRTADIWHLRLRNIKSQNFQRGFELLTPVYLDVNGIEAIVCDWGLTMSAFAGQTVRLSGPQACTLRACTFQGHSRAGVVVDNGIQVTFDSCVFETSGTTLGHVDDGGLIVGADMGGAVGSGFARSVTVRDCWFEANKGLAQAQFRSGYNNVERCGFIVPAGYSTHDTYFSGGRYSIIDSVSDQLLTANVKDTTGVMSGNRIVGGRMFNVDVDRNKTYVTDNLGPRMARVSRSATQSIPNNTPTSMLWDVEDYDPENMHSTVSNTQRLVVPAGATMVQLFAGLVFDSNASGIRRIGILKNNLDTIAGQATPGLGFNFITVDSGPVVVNPGDFFEVAVLQTSGGTLNVLDGSEFFSLRVLR